MVRSCVLSESCDGVGVVKLGPVGNDMNHAWVRSNSWGFWEAQFLVLCHSYG